MLANVVTPRISRIVLVDDTATFRALVKEKLRELYPAAEVADFAAGGPALAACLAQPPDLLIADLYLGNSDGRDIVRQLRCQGLRTHVVILTAFPEAGLPAELLALGVAGFVDKNSPLEQIERAVQCVLDGGLFFSATVPPPVPSLAGEPALPRLGSDALTERERDVVRLVARGLLSKQVADTLGLSTRTVEKYRGRIMTKLGLHDVPTLVRWCLRNGLG
ncbi:response regulator transcription factor [Opitutus sp. ER46]|uniref:LuxR C-terminal-related transcriptional regulator n=1 Tax=Opitutus sp. ER46 TaxID=2161864 RepID=UPI000D301776|nr:response regulator transcription factor [Opitutus sp. ER46]PTX98569.1 DNA-binding response regulator [Opitutus sp. ER46]